MWESDGVSHIQVEELHLAHADAKPYGDYRPEQFTVLSHKMYIQKSVMNVMCHDINDKYLAKKYCNEDAFFCDFIRRPQ